jgi:glycosyltransferase involved in cell wall biosynthesis
MRPAPELISVIVPVRNCEAYVGEQMEALAAQTHTGPWELVVVDNGCTDRSIEIVESWRERLPPLTVVDASRRRGLNYARNAGVNAARGDFLAFCDADDAAAPDWLAALAGAAERADIVGGEIELDELDLEQLNSAGDWDRPAPLGALPRSGVVAYPRGGNCGIWTSVAREIGWDEEFAFGSSDMEFGWRAHLAGFGAEYAPDAIIRLRLRNTFPAMVKQYFRYGVSEPHLYRRFRERGMPRSDTREAVRMWWWLAARWIRIRDRGSLGHWLRVAAMRCGRLCGSLRWRVLYL